MKRLNKKLPSSVEIPKDFGKIPEHSSSELKLILEKTAKTQRKIEQEKQNSNCVSQEYTVSQLHDALNGSLKSSFKKIAVIGELQSFKVANQKHIFFSIVGEENVLNAVLFHYDTVLDFEIEIGQMLRCEGELSFYGSKGNLQLVVSAVLWLGKGDEEEKLKQLTTTLEKEGLFATAKKKPLPIAATKIGLITSQAGAVRYDFEQTLREIYPYFHVFLLHVNVENDVDALCQRLDETETLDCDVVVLARGGGSRNDLRVWNNEKLVRKLAGFETPTISAVGHEGDSVLTDRVCDKRAFTPTHAAEILASSKKETEEEINNLVSDATTFFKFKVLEAKSSLAQFQSFHFRSIFQNKKQKVVADLNKQLDKSFTTIVALLDRRAMAVTTQISQASVMVERKLQQVKSDLARFQVFQLRLVFQNKQQKLIANLNQHAYKDFLIVAEKYRQQTALIQKCQETIRPFTQRMAMLHGFATVEKQKKLTKRGSIIRSANELQKGDKIEIGFIDGKVVADVETTVEVKAYPPKNKGV